MKAIHFGAGNIGRGFIGMILKENNYDLTFIDVNENIVNEIKEKNEYDIILLNEEHTKIKIKDINALNGMSEKERIVESISNCDLITTSMGKDNLIYIKDMIIAGIKKRIENNNENKIDIIACENGIKVTGYLKEEVYSGLKKEEIEYSNKYIGFVDSAVDRIVPNQENENVLDVQVEVDYEWVVDENQVKRNKNLTNVIYTDQLSFFNKRKLLTVNFAHATIGYIGYNKGYKFVSETLKNRDVNKIVRGALNDIKEALKIEFEFDEQMQNDYIEKTINRFSNKLIVDEVIRVARNPKTKLQKNDRFISPLITLHENNKSYDKLLIPIAYAYKYDYTNDEQAVEITKLIENNGIENTVAKISDLSNKKIINQIATEYNKL